MPNPRTCQDSPAQSSDSSIGSNSSSKRNISLKARISKGSEIKVPLQGSLNLNPRNSRSQ